VGVIIIDNSDGQTSKETQKYERDDFWATTSNKQLNFIQHVKTLLKINGRCAIVVPDKSDVSDLSRHIRQAGQIRVNS
jgi:type I restriction-modification system DNA methylase subunit